MRRTDPLLIVAMVIVLLATGLAIANPAKKAISLYLTPDGCPKPRIVYLITSTSTNRQGIGLGGSFHNHGLSYVKAYMCE